MTDDIETPRTTLTGWCQSHGRPDQYHACGPGRFTSSLGVPYVCVCPNHERDERFENDEKVRDN
jgi:hypothetical protein